MVSLRSSLFLVTFYSWTLLLVVSGAPLLLISRGTAIGLQRLWSRVVLWLAWHVAGIRFEIRGVDRIPKGPVLFASKHQSAWDTVIFQTIFRAPVYIMKKELLRIPIYGWYCLRTGMIPVDRKGGAKSMRTMLKIARERLDENRSIIIFPEGTRTRPGRFQGYQPGIAGLYKTLGVPLVPVALNSGVFWPKKGFAKYPGTIIVEFQEAIPPDLDRKEMLATLEGRIEPASRRLCQQEQEKT